jgi:hypothetical protein
MTRGNAALLTWGRCACAILLLAAAAGCGGSGAQTSTSAQEAPSDADTTESPLSAQSGVQQAEQVIRLRPGPVGPSVLLWSDPHPSAVLRIEPDTSVKESCSVEYPRGITGSHARFEPAEGAMLRLVASATARAGRVAIQCGRNWTMEFPLVVSSHSAASLDSVGNRTQAPASVWAGLGLALVIALAALGALAYLAMMISRYLRTLPNTVNLIANGRSFQDEVARESVQSVVSAAEGLSSTIRDVTASLTQPLNAISQTLAEERKSREERHAEQRSSGNRAAAAAPAPDPVFPVRSAEVDTMVPPVDPARHSALSVRLAERLEVVIKTAYAGRTRIGDNQPVTQEAKRLKRLTRAVAEAAALLRKQTETGGSDSRFELLRHSLERLRTRCEQLNGRLSELQGGPGTEAFPLSAYIFPTHSGVESIADSITSGLEESVRLLEGHTEPLTQQFEQLVQEYLQPALRAANFLRRRQSEPEWILPLVTELKLREYRPHQGEGLTFKHESIEGSTHTIAEVYAPGYLYEDRVLLPALVRTNDVTF